MAKSGMTWASSKFQRRCWISAFDEGSWWLWILKIYSFDSPSVAEEFLEEGWNFEQHQVRSETRYHWFPGMWFTRTSRKSNAPSSGFQVWRCSRKLEMSLVFCAELFETVQNKSIWRKWFELHDFCRKMDKNQAAIISKGHIFFGILFQRSVWTIFAAMLFWVQRWVPNRSDFWGIMVKPGRFRILSTGSRDLEATGHWGTRQGTWLGISTLKSLLLVGGKRRNSEGKTWEKTSVGKVSKVDMLIFFPFGLSVRYMTWAKLEDTRSQRHFWHFNTHWCVASNSSHVCDEETRYHGAKTMVKAWKKT